MRIPLDDLVPQDAIVYTYDKADIMQVVEAKTSLIGKYRGDKNNPDYIERMSLTEGESFVSDDMLLDAIAHVHEWLNAFSRGLMHAYGLDDKDNIFFILQPKDWWARNEYATVEQHIKNALVEYIIYQWFEITNQEEAAAHLAKYEDYAHSAQLGMNVSEGTLERRHNTPFNTIFGRR
jgi:hypothetical protein